MEPFKIDKKYLNREVAALVKEELEAVRKDEMVYPAIKELGLTQGEAETYVGSIIDYSEDVHYCANCPGLAACEKTMPHFRLRLSKEDGKVVRHYDPCDKMMSLASFKRRYFLCSFPEEWMDADLRTIERSKSARTTAILLFASIVKGESSRWPYLMGNAGSGKTYMLACLANDVSKKHGQGAFVNTGVVLEDLKGKAIKNRAAFDELFDKFAKASVLVFDDFGNEFKSEYVYTTILFPLLAAREKDGLVTAFASDFTLEQVVGMYQAKIGPERAVQLRNLLKRKCEKEIDVSGVVLH